MQGKTRVRPPSQEKHLSTCLTLSSMGPWTYFMLRTHLRCFTGLSLSNGRVRDMQYFWGGNNLKYQYLMEGREQESRDTKDTQSWYWTQNWIEVCKCTEGKNGYEILDEISAEYHFPSSSSYSLLFSSPFSVSFPLFPLLRSSWMWLMKMLWYSSFMAVKSVMLNQLRTGVSKGRISPVIHM